MKSAIKNHESNAHSTSAYSLYLRSPTCLQSLSILSDSRASTSPKVFQEQSSTHSERIRRRMIQVTTDPSKQKDGSRIIGEKKEQEPNSNNTEITLTAAGELDFHKSPPKQVKCFGYSTDFCRRNVVNLGIPTQLVRHRQKPFLRGRETYSSSVKRSS